MMKILGLALAATLAFTAARAEPTRVMVRAQASDAKFIGDQMGGVGVTLTDAKTGTVLATGVIKGGTGDTGRIMRTPRTRGLGIADPATAGFEAVLDLAQPTLVRAEAVGPLGKPAASIRVSSSLWIIPGRDVLGDGWVLDFPGLVIEPKTTATPDGGLKVTAKVSLMCGCPIEPEGIWDANTYDVVAQLMKGGRVTASAPLAYAGQPSQFAGVLPPSPSGVYTLRVIATDRKTPNAGVVDIPLPLPGR